MIATCTIDAPASALVNDEVVAEIFVTNVDALEHLFKVEIYRDDVLIYTDTDRTFYSGYSRLYTYTFDMPNNNTNVFVWIEYKRLGIWEYATSASKVISLGTEPSLISGSIEAVGILHGSIILPLPAVGIAVGDRPSIRVTVKNTCSTPYKPYINYRYTNPNGIPNGSLEGKFMELDPGGLHTFTEPAFGFDVDVPGNWLIYVEMKDQTGNILDTFAETVMFNAGGTIPYTDLANVDIAVAPGTYKIGEDLPYLVNYDYKGPAQTGYLTISLGTGIIPDFYVKHTFPVIVTELQMSTEYKPGTISGSVIIPEGAEPGQTYSVKGSLTPADGKVTKDEIDWGAFTVYEVPPLTGIIDTMQLSEFLITKDLPAPDMVKNDFFSVLVPVKNTSSYRGVFYLDCVITKPSGATIGRTNEQQTLDPGQEHTYEIQPEGIGFAFRIDETGDWYVQCILKDNNVAGANVIADTGEVHLFTAGSEGATSDLQVYDLEATLPSTHPVLGPLDTLEVGVTFKYTSTEDVELELWASLALGIGHDIETFDMIQLTKSLTEETWSGYTILSVPETGKADGEYDLRVEVAGVEVTIHGAVTIEGMPTTGFAVIGQLITMMIVMMMMTMMMNLMEDPMGTIEAGGRAVGRVGEVAAPIIKIFTGRGEDEE